VGAAFLDRIACFGKRTKLWRICLTPKVNIDDKLYEGVECMNWEGRIPNPPQPPSLVILTLTDILSHGFGVIASYCSNFGHFAFLSHPLRA